MISVPPNQQPISTLAGVVAGAELNKPALSAQTGPGAQNSRIWTALVMTGIQPAAAQSGGYAR
jgi:hypothetical protein